MGGQGSGRPRLPRDGDGRIIRGGRRKRGRGGGGSDSAGRTTTKKTTGKKKRGNKSGGRGGGRGQKKRRLSFSSSSSAASSDSDSSSSSSDSSSSSSSSSSDDDDEERGSPVVVRLRLSTLSPLYSPIRSDSEDNDGGRGSDVDASVEAGASDANDDDSDENDDGDDGDDGESHDGEAMSSAASDGGDGRGTDIEGGDGNAMDDDDDDAVGGGGGNSRKDSSSSDGADGGGSGRGGSDGTARTEDDASSSDDGATSDTSDESELDGIPFDSDDEGGARFEAGGGIGSPTIDNVGTGGAKKVVAGDDDGVGKDGSEDEDEKGADKDKESSGDDGKEAGRNEEEKGGNENDDEREAFGEKDDDGSDPPVPPNPYLNKMVRVVQGKDRGIEGRITNVEARGWWTVDSPTLVGKKVHNRVCRMIDAVTEAELRDYRELTGTNLRYIPKYAAKPEVKKGGDDDDDDDKDDGSDDDDDDESEDDGDDDDDEEDDDDKKEGGERSVDGAASDLILDSRLRKRPGRESLDRDDGDGPASSTRRVRQRRAASLSNPFAPDWRDSIPPRAGRRGAFDVPAHGRHRRGTPGRDGSRLPLPPVLLSADDDTAVPAALRHLPPDFTVDIFDRRLGRILSGDRAVKVRDLPAVLRLHAEYEPVVPPPPPPSSRIGRPLAVREGRSGQRVRVGPSVQPQCRVRASAAEGKEVLVTGGPYRGMVGKVEACIPGGWYLVSELLEDDEHELELVISSKHLELLNGVGAGSSSDATGESAKQSPRGGKGGSDDKTPTAEEASATFGDMVSKHFVMPVRKMRLKIDALKEEKKAVLQELGVDEDADDVAKDFTEKQDTEKLSHSATAVADGDMGKDSDDSSVEVQKDGGSSSVSGLRLYQLRKRREKLSRLILQTQSDLDQYLKKTAEAKEQTLQAFVEFEAIMH